MLFLYYFFFHMAAITDFGGDQNTVYFLEAKRSDVDILVNFRSRTSRFPSFSLRFT